MNSSCTSKALYQVSSMMQASRLHAVWTYGRRLLYCSDNDSALNVRHTLKLSGIYENLR
ncbi:hypothetical protein OROMI_004301 [Orobanche minor]